MAKKEKSKITVKSSPQERAEFFLKNLDNPEAYKIDEIFSNRGIVAGIYNDIKNYGGKEGIEAQRKFLENADLLSNYVLGMRQNPEPDDPDMPGITAYKGYPLSNSIRKNSKEEKKYLDQTNYGMPLGTLDNLNPNAHFGKRWDNRLKTGAKYTSGPNAGFERPGGYVYEFQPNKNKDLSYRLPKDVWEDTHQKYKKLKSGNSENLADGGLVYEDPKKTFAREGFSDVLSSGLKGGVAGIAGGPAGMAAGAIAGVLGAGLKMAFNKSEMDSQREDWSSSWARDSVKGLKGYKKGGEVKGSGGAKDDAIQKDVEPGSFIVPAENSEIAKKLGEEFLEWDGDQIARGHSSGNKVNLSDGEVLFTKDEKNILESNDIDLSLLAPNATKGTNSFKTGTTDDGIPFVKKRNPYVSSIGPDLFEIERENTAESNKFADSIDKNLDFLSESLPDSDLVSKVDLPSSGNLAKYAAIAQGVGGAIGAIASGKKRSPVISDSLRKLSADAIRDAGYGLPESVKNEMRKNSARTFRSAVNEITSKGGSAHDVYNKISGAMSQKISTDNQTEIADYQEKQRKKEYAGDISFRTDQLKTGLEQNAVNRHDAKVTGWMDVLGAGIHNVIGLEQSKNYSGALKEAKDQPLYTTINGKRVRVNT